MIELRLAGACTEEEANLLLGKYLLRFNRQFGIPAVQAQDGTSYRPLAEEVEPDTIFCMKYLRSVGADNCVRFFGQRLQVLPGPQRMSYVRAQVEVHERLDGSLAVYYKGDCLSHQSAPLEAGLLRARKGLRVQATVQQKGEKKVAVERLTEAQPPSSHKPASNHPWCAYPNRLTAR